MRIFAGFRSKLLSKLKKRLMKGFSGNVVGLWLLAIGGCWLLAIGYWSKAKCQKLKANS